MLRTEYAKNTRDMSEAHKACMLAASIGHAMPASIGSGRWRIGHTAPHAKPRHPHRTLRRWQRAHTVDIVVIAAVFQDPMFALNALAFINACGPSHPLSKSPRRISPEPRRVRSVGQVGASLCTPRPESRVRAEGGAGAR
jgi:hypothetical protein